MSGEEGGVGVLVQRLGQLGEGHEHALVADQPPRVGRLVGQSAVEQGRTRQVERADVDALDPRFQARTMGTLTVAVSVVVLPALSVAR